jgi:glycopeptide antibiotics resistance protein
MPSATYAGAFRVRFVAALAAMYLVVVLVVTLWPTPVDAELDGYIDRVLVRLWAYGVPTFVNYSFIEFSANVVFFVPVGFLLGLLLPFRQSWLAMIGGAALSAAVEVTQGLLLPGRVASPSDVVANTSGAVVGYLVALSVRMLILHRDTLVIRDVEEGRRASNGLPVRK